MSTQESDRSRVQGANFAADTAMLTVGLLVFWPALLAMPLTTDHRQDISRMRGEKEALERARDGQCSGSAPVQAGLTQAAHVVPASLSVSAAIAVNGQATAPTVPVAAPVAIPSGRLQAWPLACPPAGTVVFYSNNRSVTSEGRDRDDPRLCRVQSGAYPQRLIYGFIDQNSYGGDQYRAGLTALHEPAGIIPTGRVSDFVTFRTLANGTNQQFRERWSVGAEETIRVQAGEFRTVVVEQLVEGQGSNSHRSTNRYWLDQATGAIVRKTSSLQAGTGADGSYEAVRVTVVAP